MSIYYIRDTKRYNLLVQQRSECDERETPHKLSLFSNLINCFTIACAVQRVPHKESVLARKKLKPNYTLVSFVWNFLLFPPRGDALIPATGVEGGKGAVTFFVFLLFLSFSSKPRASIKGLFQPPAAGCKRRRVSTLDPRKRALQSRRRQKGTSRNEWSAIKMTKRESPAVPWMMHRSRAKVGENVLSAACYIGCSLRRISFFSFSLPISLPPLSYLSIYFWLPR